MDNSSVQNSKKELEKNPICTECNAIYEPANASSDIRCGNCGNHQNTV